LNGNEVIARSLQPIFKYSEIDFVLALILSLVSLTNFGDPVDPDVVKKLVDKGNRRLNEIELMRKNSEAKLLDKLEIFSNKLDCWKKN